MSHLNLEHPIVIPHALSPSTMAFWCVSPAEPAGVPAHKGPCLHGPRSWRPDNYSYTSDKHGTPVCRGTNRWAATVGLDLHVTWMLQPCCLARHPWVLQAAYTITTNANRNLWLHSAEPTQRLQCLTRLQAAWASAAVHSAAIGLLTLTWGRRGGPQQTLQTWLYQQSGSVHDSTEWKQCMLQAP